MRQACAILLVSLFAWPTATATPRRQTDVAASEYEVYSAYLQTQLHGKAANKARFNVLGGAIAADDLKQLGWPRGRLDTCSDVPAGLAVAFEGLGATTGRLDGRSFPALRVKTLRQRTFDTGPTNRAVYAFSRVAFDESTAWALVYVEVSCGFMCARGEYVVLRRTSGVWQVRCDVYLWET